MSEQSEELIDRRHFEQVPEWPAFRITGDEISGRVPVTRIRSWRELPVLLDEPCFNRQKTQLIYRGHRRYDWPLTPSLGRVDPRKIITKEVAGAQLRLFRRAVRGRLSDRTLVLATELAKNQYVDWEKRDSVKAAMRNAARVVLRRLGYPASAREAVLDQLLGVLKRENQH